MRAQGVTRLEQFHQIVAASGSTFAGSVSPHQTRSRTRQYPNFSLRRALQSLINSTNTFESPFSCEYIPSHGFMASGVSHPPRKTAAPDKVPLQHVDLPDDWRGDVERPREKWCPTCLWDGNWKHLLVRSEARTHVFAKTMLWSSADEGHICCAIFLNLLLKVGGGKYDCFTVDWSHPRGAMLAFQSERQNPMLEDYSYWTLLTIGSAPAPPGMVPCPPDELPPLDTGSDGSVSWVKERINECRHSHSHCHSVTKSRASGSRIPSRLLYIPPDPIEGLSLLLKESVPLDAKYVALSYCWGTRNKWPRCLTTNANYESHLRHIPWDSLPQTFRDTATFARKLGLEYMWIDSMCIIQGDEKDWQKESTRMYSVYSNAYITFAALHAHDSHDSLFSRRDPASLAPLITLGFQRKKFHVQAYRVPDERWGVFLQTVHGYTESHHPLLNRAWAFQERIVSPRVLYFGLEELIWECPTEFTSEGDAYLPPPWLRGDSIAHMARDTLMHQFRTISDTPDKTSQWLRIVQSYSDMKLSEPTDRLPAIAAIAQHFAQCDPDDEYICGLWRNSIHQGLKPQFWPEKNVTGPHIDCGPSAVVQSEYIAPSWSWASVQAHLRHALRVTISPCAELINVNMRYVDNDQFGRIGPGSSITLRAPVLDCVWNPEYETDGTLRIWQTLSTPCPEGTISLPFKTDYATYGGLGQRGAIEVCFLLLGTGAHGGSEAHDALILRRTNCGRLYFRLGIISATEGIDVLNSRLARVLKEAPVRECVIV